MGGRTTHDGRTDSLLTHRSRFEPLDAVPRDPLVGDLSLGAGRVRCEMNGTKDRDNEEPLTQSLAGSIHVTNAIHCFRWLLS